MNEVRQAVRAAGRRHVDDGDGSQRRQLTRHGAAAPRAPARLRLAGRTRWHDGAAAAAATFTAPAAAASAPPTIAAASRAAPAATPSAAKQQ